MAQLAEGILVLGGHQVIDDLTTGHLHRIEAITLLDILTDGICELRVVLLRILRGHHLVGLDLLNLLQGLLVWQQPLHNADMGNDGLVVAQTQIEVVGSGQQQEHQHAEPERQTPVAPLEGIILNVLGTEELIDVRGIHLEGKHLQGKALALVGLPVDLHLHRRDIVECVVERGHRIDHLPRHEAIVLLLRLKLLSTQHLDAWRDILGGLELGELYLRLLLCRC